MDQPAADQLKNTATDSVNDAGPDDDLPPGNHALEVAARRGFGPLSPLAKSAWHGQATPCVSCGQLVRRADARCSECNQDLSEIMLDKMRQHAGPWFVLEHIRPFPGVSLERIVRQIRRGLVTETSIVRGPATDFQWRFAVETPGLCRYFGKCWRCHHQVSVADTYCPNCLSHLALERPRTLDAKVEQPAAARLINPPTPLRNAPALALGERTNLLRPSAQTVMTQSAIASRTQAQVPRPRSTGIGAQAASPALQSLANALSDVHVTSPDETEFVAQRRGSRTAWFGAIFVLLLLLTVLLTLVNWRQKPAVPASSPRIAPPSTAPLSPSPAPNSALPASSTTAPGTPTSVPPGPANPPTAAPTSPLHPAPNSAPVPPPTSNPSPVPPGENSPSVAPSKTP